MHKVTFYDTRTLIAQIDSSQLLEIEGRRENWICWLEDGEVKGVKLLRVVAEHSELPVVPFVEACTPDCDLGQRHLWHEAKHGVGLLGRHVL